jgi:NADH-quinone oxidoreductase subunit K
MAVPALYHLSLSALLFTLGMIGVLVRRSALIVFMSIELMLNAVNLSLVTFARVRGNLDGQLLVFLVLVVAAVEVVVGLAIVDIFRSRETMDIDDVDLLRG